MKCKEHYGDFCLVCGDSETTIHHMRIEDIKSKKHYKKIKGVILLCRKCHDIVEEIVNKGKSKKLWFEKGYNQGFKDGQKNSSSF